MLIKFNNQYYSGRMTLKEGKFYPVMVARSEAKRYKSEERALIAVLKAQNTCKLGNDYVIERW